MIDKFLKAINWSFRGYSLSFDPIKRPGMTIIEFQIKQMDL